MNVILNVNNFNTNSIYFNNPIKNTVLDNSDSEFIKVIYSNNDVIINGIYLKMNLIYTNIIDNNNNKFIYTFNYERNKDFINKIINIENEILFKYNKHLNKTYSLKDIFTKGSIRLYSDNKNKNKFIYIKISGIWKSNNDIGLTYKIHDI
jgi:hypothetical protein